MNTNFSYVFIPKSFPLINKAAEFSGISVDEFKSLSERFDYPRSDGHSMFLIYKGMENIVVSYHHDTNGHKSVHVYRTDRTDHEYFWNEGQRDLYWVIDCASGNEWALDLVESGWKGKTWPDKNGRYKNFEFTFEDAKEANIDIWDLKAIFEYCHD